MEFRELQQIVESNSRAIQALADRIAELTLAPEEAKAEREELRQATLRIAKASAFLSPCVGKQLAGQES